MTNEQTKLPALAQDAIQGLSAWRDDLRVRIHLAGMEARDAWKELEPHVELIEAKLLTLVDDARAGGAEAADAAGPAGAAGAAGATKPKHDSVITEVRETLARIEPKLASIGLDLSQAGREILARLKRDFGSDARA